MSPTLEEIDYRQVAVRAYVGWAVEVNNERGPYTPAVLVDEYLHAPPLLRDAIIEELSTNLYADGKVRFGF